MRSNSLRTRYVFSLGSTHFEVAEHHKQWGRLNKKSKYVELNDVRVYDGSDRSLFSSVTSVDDGDIMLWPPGLAGSTNHQKCVTKFGYTLNYILAVNKSLGIDIEFPPPANQFAGVADSVYDEDDLIASAYSSGTPSGLSFWLAEYSLQNRRSDGLEDISDGNFVNPTSHAATLVTYSTISDVTDDVFDENFVEIDPVRFGRIETFRNDEDFRKICLAKFDVFARETDFKPFVMVLESEKVSVNALKPYIFDPPFYISSTSKPAFKFWLCAWWRFLYGQLYSLMQFMAFGGFNKRDKDMFRVASSIGPAEFHYMVPSEFLHVNDVDGYVDWSHYSNFTDLYRSVFDI